MPLAAVTDIGILTPRQKLKENAKSLKLRPEDFERLLKDIGFGPAEHLGSAGEGGKIYIDVMRFGFPSNSRCDDLLQDFDDQ